MNLLPLGSFSRIALQLQSRPGPHALVLTFSRKGPVIQVPAIIMDRKSEMLRAESILISPS